ECSDDLPAGPEGSRHVTGMKPQTPNPTLQTQTLHLKPKPQTLHLTPKPYTPNPHRAALLPGN
ncbi:MAG: hypothetical protein K0U55_07405, partial [Gammaproteobacteria bacterium]|nr:hypothetical protein [Gammaproteobacteria bacterium]